MPNPFGFNPDRSKYDLAEIFFTPDYENAQEITGGAIEVTVNDNDVQVATAQADGYFKFVIMQYTWNAQMDVTFKVNGFWADDVRAYYNLDSENSRATLVSDFIPVKSGDVVTARCYIGDVFIHRYFFPTRG